MTQEVMDALLLHEIKVMYESSVNELFKFHDLLCNLRLKVKELEAGLRFKEKRGGIVIMPNPKSFKEKIDYLIKNKIYIQIAPPKAEQYSFLKNFGN